MDISIFGYKLNLEILILIGVVYLILVGHTVCGCCNMGKIIEGLEVAAEKVMDNASGKKTEKVAKALATVPMGTQVAPVTPGTIVPSTAATTDVPVKEAFTGANINYGESSLYNLNNDQEVNTSSWSAQNMTVTPGQPLSAGVKQFLSREPQPVPLPEGEMLMFANTPFKPECCPNTFSTSTGCACMTGKQYNYLILRGGNNVPYSEY